ncbi:MAG: GGDEF domain-containing protein [Gammaproteobacteria bacterium]
MATTAAGLSEDWKDKYFKALNELEAQTQAYAAQTRRHGRDLLGVLEHFTGRETQFDAGLARARRAFAANDPELEAQLRSLLASFERLADPRPGADDDSLAPFVTALVDACGYANALNDLVREVQASDSRHAQLELVRAIGARLDELLTAAPADAGDDACTLARDTLQSLLDHLSLPPDAQTRLAGITPHLQDASDGNELRAVARELAAFVGDLVSSLQAEITGLNGFLLSIKGRLDAVSGHVVEESRDRKRAAAAREHLDNTVRRSLDDMRGKVQHTSDLEALKAAIQHQIAHLDHSVSGYLELEGLRATSTEVALRRLADQLVAMKRESELLRDKLAEAQARASRDVLTGLPNRLADNERVEVEHARMQRSGKPLSLAVLDLDHFKIINDNWGHQAGDRVLRHLARELGAQIRASDFFARLGGEEFVLLLPETALPGARVVVEKLREHIARCRFKYKDAPVAVTVSCGITEFRAGETPHDAFARADAALYAAKSAGRNRCEAAAAPAQASAPAM